MPVRKNSKSAAKPLAKKVAAAKKSKKKVEDSLGQRIASAIAEGKFDGDLGLLDDALTDRANHLTATKTAAPKKSTTSTGVKKVSPPPKKNSSALVPEPGKTYGITDKFKPLAGAKVKFIRFKADSDEKKSLVEMLTDKPGNPKGKKVVIPSNALIAAPARARK
jgi:hypothetical protein